MEKPGIIIAIPGRQDVHLRHLLLDYNGTLACDGELLDGVVDRLLQLAETLHIEVITADTFGSVQRALQNAGAHQVIDVHILPAGHAGHNEAHSKRDRLYTLGAAHTCAIGNGYNDRMMLQEAGLSIALLGREGLCIPTLLQAQTLCSSITDALDLLLYPKRYIATLRE